MNLHEFAEKDCDFLEAVEEYKRIITNLFNAMKTERFSGSR